MYYTNMGQTESQIGDSANYMNLYGGYAPKAWIDTTVFEQEPVCSVPYVWDELNVRKGSDRKSVVILIAPQTLIESLAMSRG